MMRRFVDLTLPAHWASYLINGDDSSLFLNHDQGDEEIALIEKILKEEGLGSCVSCSDEPEFRRTHDATPYGELAGSCLNYTFELPYETNQVHRA